MKQFSIILLLVVLSLQGFAEMVTLSGYLKDKKNGEGLIGATVYIPEIKTGVITNPYGFYSISVPEGNYSITFSFIGYQTQAPLIKLNGDRQLDIMLEEDTKEIGAVSYTHLRAHETRHDI